MVCNYMLLNSRRETNELINESNSYNQYVGLTFFCMLVNDRYTPYIFGANSY